MNKREFRTLALEVKRLEFLDALAAHLDSLFAAAPELTELRLAPTQLIRLIRRARLPVWTYSDIQICKVVGDALHWGKLLLGKNEYRADGGRSGIVIFQKKT